MEERLENKIIERMEAKLMEIAKSMQKTLEDSLQKNIHDSLKKLPTSDVNSYNNGTPNRTAKGNQSHYSCGTYLARIDFPRFNGENVNQWISLQEKSRLSTKDIRGSSHQFSCGGGIGGLSHRRNKSEEMRESCTDNASFIHGEMRRNEEKATLAHAERPIYPSEKQTLDHVQDALLHLHACREPLRKCCRFTGHSNEGGCIYLTRVIAPTKKG
ncbi:hypothetical protein Fmac_032396 [Flemingia macrophylla]|uniref:Uncharacterized protein n=1 Tax=Flemingia macrophylla TaxID=520843 RepID=A0ABD1L4T3_9FABA